MTSESVTLPSTPSTLLQTAAAKLSQLPLEQQQQVLDFIEFLAQKSQLRPSLWDKIDAIVEQIPEQAWDVLPTDGSEQHDHYLYGAPKQQK
ncbi:hypothetical protein IQ249_05075 [Lusitaniella coriacea LEGE 07157]|uniref:DUF2281 domain-containing protein n=2 Tax=Lusitaniella TaxID=1983104 RepID=A0A8J7DNW2_9CYAN|nr:hypothetical protein [Lusitaniella coriacea]MBE9115269.1 hypothetical protein [Lusitaniella coriacea LEGE 07157]